MMSNQRPMRMTTFISMAIYLVMTISSVVAVIAGAGTGGGGGGAAAAAVAAEEDDDFSLQEQHRERPGEGWSICSLL